MKHRVAGRKLGRTSAHRLAVLRNLSTDLFRHERIRTTLMKAKELRPFAERLITVGRQGDIHSRRRLARHIRDAVIAKKLVETIATRFAERPGGYTRILKLGPRRGDSAEMAIIELLGSELVVAAKDEGKKEKGGLGGRIRERFSRRRRGPATEGEGAQGDATAAAVAGATAKAAKAVKAVKTPKDPGSQKSPKTVKAKGVSQGKKRPAGAEEKSTAKKGGASGKGSKAP